MPSPRYKIRYRDAEEEDFREGSVWYSCEECILALRRQSALNPLRDFQIVDESGLVIASTFEDKRLRQTCNLNS
jgi:hypothetical protein